MPLEIVQPEGLDQPETYSHVITATGGKVVFIAGQMSDDADGNLLGVETLAVPGYLIEVDGIAVVD